jgi:hypothetical protein
MVNFLTSAFGYVTAGTIMLSAPAFEATVE